MIAAFALFAVAQVVVPGAEGLSLDQRFAVLAEKEADYPRRIESAIFDDPAMRAEVRRVGFATGCTLVASIGRDVAGRHAATLRPAIDATLRKVIPTKYVAEARAISFLVTPLSAYRGRFEEALEQTAAPALAAAREDMRRTFLARSAPLPAVTDPAANAIAPKPDVAAALGHRGNWDLDNPAQLAFACAEHRISPRIRPTITTGDVRQ